MKHYFKYLKTPFSIYSVTFFSLFFLATIRQAEFDNYGCEICSDKAGYYMYLPAVFENGFYAKNYNEGFDHQHGDGFYFEDGKLKTKFSCGLAMMQLPFYTMGKIISSSLSLHYQPYSSYYLFFVNIGAAFYLTLAFVLLRKWLTKRYNNRNTIYTMIIIFFGTHLIYYATDETLMSHIYSFFLCSCVIYFLQEYFSSQKPNHFICFAISLSMAVLVRPTNILFLLFAFIFDSRASKDKFNILFSLKNLIVGLFVAFIIMLPQMIYWNFAFDKFIIWSYKNEGFFNWNKPDFITGWLSPKSGLFPYSIVLVVPIFVSIYMFIEGIRLSLIPIFVFFIVSYMCASWSSPFFGACNYGKRPFVEYLPFFMPPLAWLLEKLPTLNLTKRRIIQVVLVLMIYYNLALYSAFNTCFDKETWDYENFFKMICKGLTIIR